eukprot:CAMPEP_0201868422 /NCGR_PEP_ID=MMETSP0902-20130614/2313_1 /ASSEMBLY_ACC=CAM_ASM_000551 /TAXON_ID=420261 /ORGANISM="Thalassiosira antarctica, Strain CCMP982" /LENGTH=111 /DNA_ID=CAMNT_0048393765 /DNA_START=419 /DNA_END=754 /DNA_ORIENTATION=-
MESDNVGGSNDDDSVAMEDDESYLPEFAISNYDRGQRGLQQQQARSLQAHASERIHSPSWDGLKVMIEDADQFKERWIGGFDEKFGGAFLNNVMSQMAGMGGMEGGGASQR